MQNLQKPDSFSFLKKRNVYDDAGLRVEKIFSEDVTHGTQIPCVEWSPEGKLQCSEVFCFQSHSSQTHAHTCAAVPTSKLLLQSCICFPEKIFSSCFKWSFSICSSVLHFWDILHLNISGYKIIKIRHHIEEKKTSLCFKQLAKQFLQVCQVPPPVWSHWVILQGYKELRKISQLCH